MVSYLIEEIIIWFEGIGYYGAFLAGGGFLPSKLIAIILGSIKESNLVIISLLFGLGGVFGSSITYLIGYYFRNKDILKFLNGKGKFLHISEDSYKSTRKHVKKEGILFIFLSRFVGGLRLATSLVAGYLKFNYLIFALTVFIGTFSYAYLFTYIGSRVGFNWSEIKKVIDTFNTVIIVIIVILVVYYIYSKGKKWTKKSKK